MAGACSRTAINHRAGPKATTWFIGLAGVPRPCKIWFYFVPDTTIKSIPMTSRSRSTVRESHACHRSTKCETETTDARHQTVPAQHRTAVTSAPAAEAQELCGSARREGLRDARIWVADVDGLSRKVELFAYLVDWSSCVSPVVDAGEEVSSSR